MKHPLPYEPTDLARALFEQAEDALFLFDPEAQQILDANPPALRLTGLSREQLLQQPIAALVRSEAPADEEGLHDALRQARSSGGHAGLLLCRQEQERWLPVRLTIARLPSKSRTLGLLTARDRSEERSLQTRLSESERQYRDLAETSDDLIWSIDVQGRLTYLNRKATRTIYGYEPEEMLGRHFKDFVAPESVDRYLRTFQEIQAGQSLWRYETTNLRKDGTRVLISCNVIPIRDDQGRLAGFTGTGTDITHGKETEAALLESRQRFETFMNTIPMVGFMKDQDGRLIYVNRAFTDRFILPAEHFLGKLDHELWPAEIARKLRETDVRVMTGAGPVELREWVPTPDGVLREWWVVKFPFHNAQGRVFLGGVALDLTERQQLEEALRRSEERYHQLWQRNLAGITRNALDGRILDCNDAFAHIFGYGSRAEMCTHSTKEFYFDLDVRAEFLAQLREKQHLTNYEVQVRRADGAPIWVLGNASLLTEHGEEIIEGTVIDITERKRAEEALRASEANYRTLIDHLDQAIFLKDRALRYVTVNPVFCAAVGLTEDELCGKTIGEVFPVTPLTERSRTLEKRVLDEGRAIETEEIFKVKGKPSRVRVNRTPVKDQEGATVGVLSIGWDVTEQRELEAQLRHVQKMDAIGQLAGGIAHDFNNLLTIMLGNLSYILSGALDMQTTLELARNVEKAGLRAAELTRTLLDFSHQAVVATIPCNLNSAIAEVVRLTHSTLPTSIELEVRADANLWLVQADPTQMSQILMNLTFNARDALPEGGKITYQTGRFVPDAEYLSSHVEARPGEFVRLSVKDNGVGIPVKLRQRIFEPFFTTKEKGKGTGLGLATVFSIVKQHGGWIVCASAPGRGTTFDIFLPRCLDAAIVAPPLPPMKAAAVRATILVVDDEAMIRQLVATILSEVGYEVLVAEDGAVALDVFQAHQDQIALVILDAVMPRLSGCETLRELARLAPGVSVLFSSGYSTEHLALNEFPQVRGLLPKPYHAEQLVQKVIEILGQVKTRHAQG